MSTTLIVLFNLKPDADSNAYEDWAKKTDLATVRSLGSVDDFKVYRSTGLLMSEDIPPYQYVELITVSDMDAFGSDISTDTMKKVAGEFQAFADNPLFMLTHNIER